MGLPLSPNPKLLSKFSYPHYMLSFHDKLTTIKWWLFTCECSEMDVITQSLLEMTGVFCGLSLCLYFMHAMLDNDGF